MVKNEGIWRGATRSNEPSAVSFQQSLAGCWISPFGLPFRGAAKDSHQWRV